MVTHDLRAQQYASRLITMVDGRIVDPSQLEQ